MNNETDLDWLARNHHTWPSKADAVVSTGWKCMKAGEPDYIRVNLGKEITKDQWLSRRAELQNKPSWEEAPVWATHLAQNGRGQWWFMLNGKQIDDDRRYFGSDRSTIAVAKGEVLGDWRDTLEKRPEQKAFDPFVSIEDNQEKDMKQDNGWFERGELPPVGTECEIDLGAKWRKAFVVGRNYTGRIVVEIDTCDFIVADGCTFRPIRTEREVLIEIIKKTDDTDDRIADAILAAGFKLEVK